MSQAQRVIERFGGPYKLAHALSLVYGRKIHASTIYRWTYPVDKGGTGGLIPTKARRMLRQAARLHGVALTAEDMA